jgi:hypothetical protein
MKMGFLAGTSRRGMSTALLAVLLLAGCGADRQKEADEIAKGIESYLALMEGHGQELGLRHDKVTVTPDADGKSFAVAITGLGYGTNTVKGATIGEVDYRLTPQDANTYQVDNLKLSNEIPLVGPDGASFATLKADTTSFSALWSSPFHNFLQLDWVMKALAMHVSGAADDAVKADATEVHMEGKEATKGLLDETGLITMAGVSGTNAATGSKFSLARLTGNFGMQGLDSKAYTELMAKLRTVMQKVTPQEKVASQPDAAPQNGDTATAPAKPEPLSAEDAKVLADAIRALPKVIAGYQYDLEAEGWVTTAADGSPMAHVAKAGMNFGLKGLNTDKAEFDFGIHHDGLTLDGPEFQDPATKALAPKSSSISLAATDLPVPALVEAVAGAIPDLTSQDPNTAAGGKIEIAGALMSALAKSDIKLSIEPSKLDTEIAHLAADGDLKLALQSPLKAVGAVNLALVGLDDIIALANTEAQDHPQAAGAIGMLQMVQSYAKREAGADGKPVDKFTIDLGASGAITINDKPLNGL